MKHRIIKAVPFIWMFFGILWDIWYYITRGKIMLDSDVSAGMVLSDVLNSEHSLTGLSTNWLYSSELRFLHMQWFFRLGLLLFPNNWHMARAVASSIALCLMAFAVWLVFHAIERNEWGIWAAAMTVFPGGGWYFWQTIYGTQHMPYIMISFYSFALILLSTRDGKKTANRIFVLIAVLLAFGAGLNGIKQLMVFYAPLLLSVLFVVALKAMILGDGCIQDKRLFKERVWRMFIMSCIISAVAFAGYLVNSKILSKIYSFKQYSNSEIDYQSFLEMLRMYLWSFGFIDGKKLMSPTGIASMCGVLFGMIVFFSAIRLLWRFKELDEGVQMLTVMSVTSILFCCFIYSYVKSHGAIQYYQPVIPFGYCLVVMEIFTEHFRIKHSSFAAINMAMLILLVTSAGTVHNEQNEPFHKYRARPTLGPIVDMLVEKGYTQGVSLYWTSVVVRELSDGKIEMWSLDDTDPTQFEGTVQKKSHLEAGPTGRYFYIFDYGKGEDYEWYDEETNAGLAYVEAHPYPTALQPIYYDDTFIVYGN